MSKSDNRPIDPEFLESLSFTVPSRVAVGCLTYTFMATGDITIIAMLYPDDACEVFIQLHQMGAKEFPSPTRDKLACLTAAFIDDPKPKAKS